MKYNYIVDDIKNIQIDYDVDIEQLNNNNTINNKLYKVISDIKLNYKKNQLYKPLRFISNNEFDNKIEKIKYQLQNKFNDVNYIIEKEGNINKIIFFSYTLPIYLKENEIKKLLECKFSYNKIFSNLEINSNMDMENIKNYYHIKNKKLPQHSLLFKDKELLLNMLNDGIHLYIKDINYYLANNSIPNYLIPELFYKKYNEKKGEKKIIFSNIEDALKLLLFFKINNEFSLLISEKNQWIVYYYSDNGEKILKKEEKILKKEETFLQTLNTFKFDDEIIISDDKNPIYFTSKNKPLPLHIVANHGQHHHCYYYNGFFNGLIEPKKCNIDVSKINFILKKNSSVSSKLIVIMDDKNKILHDDFFSKKEKENLLCNNLKKLFHYGYMLKPYSIVYKNYTIDDIFLPDWIIEAKNKKDIFNYLCNLP